MSFLLLGLPSVGKTLFVRKLKQMCRVRQTLLNINDTMPTLGVELDEVYVNKQLMSVREVGGCFSSVWPRYYGDCNLLLFMIDASNQSQLAYACIELFNTISSPEMYGKPVIILLNKTDLPLAMSRAEINEVLRLDDLIVTYPAVDILEISAHTDEGLPLVLETMYQRTVQAKETAENNNNGEVSVAR